MKAKNIYPIKTMSKTFPVGTEFDLTYEAARNLIIAVSADGRALLRVATVSRYFKQFKKQPNDRAIYKMLDDGIATSITGKSRIECDGYGSDGFPAWPLALGMI